METGEKIWVALAGLATGATALYIRVKKAAAQLLDREGAFEEIKREDNEAYDRAEETSKKPSHGQEVAAIENEHWQKHAAIIHARGADTFSGAWRLLPSEARTKCVAFASAMSIVSGVIVYGVGRMFTNSSARGSSRNSGGGGSDGGGGWFPWVGGGDGGSGGGHHHGGGGFHGGDGGGHGHF